MPNLEELLQYGVAFAPTEEIKEVWMQYNENSEAPEEPEFHWSNLD